MHDKALVISRFWAGTFSAIFVAAVVGGFTYAWSANAQIAVLQRDVTDLNDVKIDVRLTRIEEQVRSTNEKLDRLIDRPAGRR